MQNKAITKEKIRAYKDTRIELEETENEIKKIDQSIIKLQEEKVIDKVYGGFGGKQGFSIEGIPIAEIQRMERLLIKARTNFVKKQNDLLELKNEIETFISNIPIPRDRIILEETCIQGKKQQDIANKINVERSTISKILRKYIA